MACNQGPLDPPFNDKMLVEWCFLGKRLLTWFLSPVWRLRSTFCAHQPGVRALSGVPSGLWSQQTLHLSALTFSWSVSPGYRHHDVMKMTVQHWVWETGRMLLCSAGVLSQSDAWVEQTKPDHQLAGFAGDFLGFPFWFWVQSRSVLPRRDVGTAKSAF